MFSIHIKPDQFPVVVQKRNKRQQLLDFHTQERSIIPAIIAVVRKGPQIGLNAAANSVSRLQLQVLNILILWLLKIVSGFGNDCSRFCKSTITDTAPTADYFKAIKKKKKKKQTAHQPEKSHTLSIGLFGSRVNQVLIKLLKLSRSLTELPRTWGRFPGREGT